MKEEDAVYDVVDEKEYAERVKGRVEEGFIVDDDGEYVEDGRYGEHICRTRNIDWHRMKRSFESFDLID